MSLSEVGVRYDTDWCMIVVVEWSGILVRVISAIASLLFLRVSVPLGVALCCFRWRLGMVRLPHYRTLFFNVLYMVLRLSWSFFAHLLG